MRVQIIEKNIFKSIYFFSNSITSPTIRCLSFGLLSATRSVIAVRASGVMFDSNLYPTLLRNQRKQNAPVLLFPSTKG